ncbi:MAG: AMP-binding protein, partial [Thermocrispum sp.]
MPNLSELASTAAGRDPAGVALVDSAAGQTLTWAQFDAAINAEAGRLLAAGMTTGDRVAVRLPTSAAFAVTLLAVMRAGGIAVPTSPQAPVDELQRLLEHSGARLLVSDRGGLEGVVVGSVLEPPAVTLPGGAGDVPAVDPVGPVGSGEDIALLCYTTASLGKARGVMLSHRALLANVAQVAAIEPAPVTAQDRMLVAIPLFHVYGLGLGLLQCAHTGATAVLAERFDAQDALADCARHEITVVLGVPTMYAELSALPAAELTAGLASARLLISGAAALRPKVLAAVEQATGLGVFEGYGLTETAPALTATMVTGYPKPGSVGRPIPGVELRLVDDDPPDDAADDELLADLEEEEGVTGLVCVRGANLFSGYWPDGVGGPDDDGWFRTSDIGYLDTDGDLHLVDRANDMIIVNGFNVYPHEVEDVIAELPEVAEVAVVGVLDDRTGEAVKAVVVPAPSAALSEQQVVQHCAEKLA